MEQKWWYCLKHETVEPDLGCANTHRLGPYATKDEAERGLQTVRERNEQLDAEDAEWEN